MKRLLVSIQAAFVVLLASSFAFAAPSFKDQLKARKLTAEAKKLAQKGKKTKAAKKFAKADKLVPAPSTKLELAKILVDLEDFVQASDVLEECMDQSPVRAWGEKKAQTKCIELASEVDDKMPRLAVVVIEPSSEEVIIMIDGEDYDPSEGEIGYNPGKFKITAEADGYDDYKKKVKLEEGDRKTIEITLKGGIDEEDEEDEEDEDSGGLSPIPAYIAWGLGAAGVGVGIGFGVAAIQTTNQVLADYKCENGECPKEAENDLNIAKLNGNLSTAGFIIGGVGVAAGTILYLLADTGDDGDEEEGDDDDDDDGMLKIEARPILAARLRGRDRIFLRLASPSRPKPRGGPSGPPLFFGAGELSPHNLCGVDLTGMEIPI